MPIINPVAPHVGLEPLSLRTASSDLAAHVLAAISRASSVVDTRPSAVVSTQLSLKGLLQSESVQTVLNPLPLVQP